MHQAVLASTLAVAAALATMSIPRTFAREAFGVGIHTITSAEPSSSRRLEGYIWYPSTSVGPVTLIEDDAVMTGFTAVRDAPVAWGRHPLVVLSHGRPYSNCAARVGS